MRTIGKISAVLTAASLILSMFMCIVFAAEAKQGTVIGNSVRVRSGAGTGYNILAELNVGEKVTVLDEAKDSGGDLWYKVTTAGNITGYMSAQWVKIEQKIEYTPDADFEAYLTAQKFPESYKDGLRTLHAQHPNWVFVAQHLSLTWDEALKAEAAVGHSLVSGSAKASWKSMEYGAYNWDTRSYVSFDSGGWVSAQREVVAYYMDPRNFLDDTSVFQFESLSYSSVHTEEGVRNILKGSFMESMAGDFMQAADKYDVSVYHLASRAYQEQGKEGNALGKGTAGVINGVDHNGYYNIFDIRAVASGNLTAIQNGAMYAKSQGWNTAKKSIDGGAQFIGKNYINVGQDTIYLQRFDFIGDKNGKGYYNHEYMTNISAAASEAIHMKKAYNEDVLNSALVFNIPVLVGMPDKPCAAPEKTDKNNDNTLTGLSVDGYSLTPSFGRYTTEYTVTLPATSAQATVKATKSDSGASVTGDGVINLSGAETTVNIKVTAPSGLVRTYTLHIYRPGADGTPSVSSQKYAVGIYVTGIKPGTSAVDFLAGFTVQNGSARLVNAAGETVDKVATGHQLQLVSGGTVFASYPLVIYGDVTGDGVVSTKDLLVAQKHILGISSLSGATLSAADSGKDGKVSTADLLRSQKQILGIIEPIV